MTPSARLAAVIEILTEIYETPRPADALMSKYFRGRRYIGSKDRGAVSQQVYDILRHHCRLNWWMDKKHKEQTPRMRVFTYLRLVLENSPKEISEYLDGTKYAPDNLSEDEDKMIRQLKGHTLFHPDIPDEVMGECPDWAAEGFKARFKGSFKSECESLLDPAPLDLRVNPLKTTREEALAELKELDLAVTKTPYSPLGLRVKKRPALGTIKMLRDGSIEIQDEGSQLVAFLVDPKPGERVVDFCAGAGGKTLAMSAAMQNKGRIIACDVLDNRLKRSLERFRKAELFNIETRVLTSERDAWVKRHKKSCDRVLVDAPCSGTGTWRRNPDARWKELGPGLDNLLPLQASILESACRLVKEGGRLVYATCSMLPEENDEQVAKFLDNHPEFKLVPVQKCGADIPNLPDTGDFLSLSPAKHNTDGFFGAVMERKKDPKVATDEKPEKKPKKKAKKEPAKESKKESGKD